MSETSSTSTGYPRKRARTRRRLLEAGSSVLAERGPDGATVGAIAAAAGVTPATFYNHFSSLNELVDSVVAELAVGVEIGRDTLAAVENDPAARVAIGTEQLLDLAVVDPTAANAFVSLLASVPELRSRVRGIVIQAVADGIDSGRFRQRSAPVTADALLGAVVQWIRSALAGDTSGSRGEQLAIALEIVGLDEREVGSLIEVASSARTRIGA